MDLPDINSVQVALGGDVVIVGKDHNLTDGLNGDHLFSDIAHEVIEEVQPRTAAIEARRPGSGRCCAMSHVQQYAREAGIPLLAVDSGTRKHWPDGVERDGLYDIINNVNTDEDGNYDPEAMYRSRVECTMVFGEAAAHAVWRHREHEMAGRVLWALENGYEAPVVLACGYYHARELRKRLGDPDHERIELSDDRIRDAQKTQT